MEWSNEAVLNFLHAYQAETIIWNPKHSGHKDRKRVREAWKRIRTAMSEAYTVNELKAKKMSLMATYRKLATKVQTSIDAGTGEFAPDWFAYDIMDRFLRGIYKPRTAAFAEDFSIGFDDDDPEFDTDDEISLEVGSLETSAGLDNYRPPVSSRKRTAANMDNDMFTDYGQEFQYSVAPPQDWTTDACSLYGKLVAVKLRSLDEETRDFAMLEIDKILIRLKRRRPAAVTAVPYRQLNGGTSDRNVDIYSNSAGGYNILSSSGVRIPPQHSEGYAMGQDSPRDQRLESPLSYCSESFQG